MAKCTGYWFVERLFAKNFATRWEAKPVFDALKTHKKLSVLVQSLKQFKTYNEEEQNIVTKCVKTADSCATWKQFESDCKVEVGPDFLTTMPSYVCLSNFEDKETYDRFVEHHKQEVEAAKQRHLDAQTAASKPKRKKKSE